ncbi:hypothetical protein KTF21_20620 [Burkholderia multivorans]|uniref:hypothetical protein n=1 Tax=Burkholderia multivorans TaxID=87883 RepID=UPI001C219ABE|nr:hypothetical protein [Burkholderia multivorans]MBU9651087.1 hypothetical protein [Burkholderia multivorans]
MIRQYERQAVTHKIRGVLGELSGASRGQQAVCAAHLSTLSAWREAAAVLAESPGAADRRMAKEIVGFVARMPVMTNAHRLSNVNIMPLSNTRKGSKSEIPRFGEMLAISNLERWQLYLRCRHGSGPASYPSQDLERPKD